MALIRTYEVACRRSFLLLICLSVPWLSATAQTERWVNTPAALRAAIAASDPGDTVVMENGVWTDVEIEFHAEGLVGDTITLKAETPGQVILNGRSRLEIGGSYLKVDGLHFDGGALTGGHVIEFRRSSSNLANHSRLTNCAVTAYNPPNRLTQYKWVSIYGTYNRVDHCHFSGKTHDGATVVVWLRDPPNDAPVWHQIDHNYFGHRPDLGKNGGESLRIGTSSRSMQDANVVVEHNLFEECDGEIEIISNKSGNNVFRHNTFRRSSGTLTLRHGNEAHVHGNFFLGENKSGTGGVRIIGERHRVYNNYFQDLRGTGYRAALAIVNGIPNSPLNRYFQVKRAMIVSNTFVNVEETFVVGAGKSSSQSLPPDSLEIANNLVSTSNGPIVEYVDTPLHVTYEANVFHGANVGLTDTTGITARDPQLQTQGELWRPSASSFVVDTGVAYPFVDMDMDGQPRSGVHDIGADEWSSAPMIYAPRTRNDTGPEFQDLILQSVDTEQNAPLASLDVYPHPFQTTATLEFTLGVAGPVHVALYDILGREVARLAQSYRASGEHRVVLDASRLAPGAYVVVLESSGRRWSQVVVRR